MTELERLCEAALYEELAELKDGKSIVRDNSSGRIYFRKRLTVYNLQVFQYLQSHRSRYVPGIIRFWQDGEELVVIEELIQGRTLDEILSEEEKVKEKARGEGPLEKEGLREEEGPQDKGDCREDEESRDKGDYRDEVELPPADSAQSSALSFEERIRILSDICDGLQFLHSATPPIIHRDLKASNIMLTEDGTVKIIDYDAAKVYVQGQDKDTVLIGTQGLAAPEQYGFAQSNVRTDLYALGKLVERMLPDNTDARRIVDRATRMDPKKRYASAQQMKDQIRRIRPKVPALDRKLEHLPGYDSQNPVHRVLGRVIPVFLAAAVVVTAVFCYFHFKVFPERRLEASGTALQLVTETVESDAGWQAGAESLKAFLGEYSYAELTQEQQKEVRSCAETIMQECMRGSSSGGAGGSGTGIDADLSNFCAELEELTGVKKPWENARTYAEVRQMCTRSDYAGALVKMKGMVSGSGADGGGSVPEDYEERLQTLYDDIMRHGEEQEDTFRKGGVGGKLSTPLDTYALIKEDHTPAREAYENLFRDALEMADTKMEEGEYTTAESLYRQLSEHENVTDTDLQAKRQEAVYREARSLFEAGKYKEAAELFAGIAGYKDSEEMAKESAYMRGLAYMDPDWDRFDLAAEAFASIPGYKDADEKCLEAKYAYCDMKKENPDDTAYAYLSDLLEAEYDGAGELETEIYSWHAEIESGIQVSVGGYQCEEVRATLHGGPADGTTTIKFEIIDHTTGQRGTWSDGESYGRGESSSCSYYKDDLSWDLFDREFTVNVYDENGQKIGSWTGHFSNEFLKD